MMTLKEEQQYIKEMVESGQIQEIELTKEQLTDILGLDSVVEIIYE